MKATLILENGLQFPGNAFGSISPSAGEVVFNTAMTGYPESLTDPSYKGQVLVATYPLVGNYGVPGEEAERPRQGEAMHIPLSKGAFLNVISARRQFAAHSSTLECGGVVLGLKWFFTTAA